MKVLKNGWAVILENVDLKTITDAELFDICKLLSTDAVVVCKNQHLTTSDQVEILKRFSINQAYESYLPYTIPGTEGLLFRVTLAKDENGNPGMYADAEGLPWHSDNPLPVRTRDISWLYGVKGTVGSITSWCHTGLAFNDFDNQTKELAKNLKAKMMNFSNPDGSNDVYVPLIQPAGMGEVSWMFPFTQIEGFEGMSIEQSQELISKLSALVLQEKYLYHHSWEDNDLVLFNQRNSIHKRSPFNNMEDRLLHKAAMGFPEEYSNVV